MHKKINVIGVILLFSLSLSASELRKVSVQLLWKHQFEFAGYYMAKERGFYKDVGLDVELNEYEFGMNIAQNVSEGKADFGVGSSSLILDKINGLDVYLLMPAFQNSPFVLMAKQRDDIKSVSDLKGKRIMLTQNQASMASLNAMFKVNHLSNKDFIEINHSFNIQDLIADKTDAMSVYLSNEPYFMIENKIKYTILNPSEYGFNFYDDILFTSKKLETKNPQMIKDFEEATKKGWEYAYTHIEESANVILQKYNTQGRTLAHLVYEGNELKKISHFGASDFGTFKPEIISQIIQTYNLLDISKSTVNINQLIYPDAMYRENNINFALLIKIAFGVFILLLAFYFWNRKLSKLNKKIQENQKKVSLLLNNAGQGFLTFQSDFKIDSEYSKECERLLGENIASKDIGKVLFDETKKEDFFKTTLLNAMKETMEIKRNSYLSLLPSVISLNKRAIKLEYKIIEDETFMMVITNVTTQKKLENKIKKEQEIFKMIVAVASESTIFYDVINEYENFIYSAIDVSQIEELYRTIHTFKGAFSQLYMEEIAKSLHTLESQIANSIQENNGNQKALTEIIENHDFHTSFIETKRIIGDILGDEFLKLHNFVKIDFSNIVDLQNRIFKVLSERDEITPECEELLCKIQDLSKQSVYNLLKPYSSLVAQLAKRFEKEIDELVIDGDRELLIDEKLKPFIKSLIHIFRNSVDHGIETPDIRVEKEKEEIGTISCEFKKIGHNLQIIIADDGAGLNKEKINKKALEIGIDATSLDEEQLFLMIFNDNFTTKEQISDISGRGIGMCAVKNELEKLNGVVKIISQKDIGTTFEFVVPL